jgi:hypothetical protein
MSSISARSRPGTETSRATWSLKRFVPLRPIPTRAVTDDSFSRVLLSRATRRSALSKHAAYPAAKSCSGLVASPPGPPSSLGCARRRLRTPSEERTCPIRPPFAVTSARREPAWLQPLLSVLIKGRLSSRRRIPPCQSVPSPVAGRGNVASSCCSETRSSGVVWPERECPMLGLMGLWAFSLLRVSLWRFLRSRCRCPDAHPDQSTVRLASVGSVSGRSPVNAGCGDCCVHPAALKPLRLRIPARLCVRSHQPQRVRSYSRSAEPSKTGSGCARAALRQAECRRL